MQHAIEHAHQDAYLDVAATPVAAPERDACVGSVQPHDAAGPMHGTQARACGNLPC